MRTDRLIQFDADRSMTRGEYKRIRTMARVGYGLGAVNPHDLSTRADFVMNAMRESCVPDDLAKENAQKVIDFAEKIAAVGGINFEHAARHIVGLWRPDLVNPK